MDRIIHTNGGEIVDALNIPIAGVASRWIDSLFGPGRFRSLKWFHAQCRGLPSMPPRKLRSEGKRVRVFFHWFRLLDWLRLGGRLANLDNPVVWKHEVHLAILQALLNTTGQSGQ